jgi:hypothetical protein
MVLLTHGAAIVPRPAGAQGLTRGSRYGLKTCLSERRRGAYGGEARRIPVQPTRHHAASGNSTEAA